MGWYECDECEQDLSVCTCDEDMALLESQNTTCSRAQSMGKYCSEADCTSDYVSTKLDQCSACGYKFRY